MAARSSSGITSASGRGRPSPSGAELMRLPRVVGRAVEELAGELVPRQPPVADEVAQGVLGADTEPVVQLVDEVSGFRVVDERLVVATRVPAREKRAPANAHRPCSSASSSRV